MVSVDKHVAQLAIRPSPVLQGSKNHNSFVNIQIYMFKYNAIISGRIFQLPCAVNIPSHNVLSAFTTKPASHSANKENKTDIINIIYRSIFPMRILIQ